MTPKPVNDFASAVEKPTPQKELEKVPEAKEEVKEVVAAPPKQESPAKQPEPPSAEMKSITKLPSVEKELVRNPTEQTLEKPSSLQYFDDEQK